MLKLFTKKKMTGFPGEIFILSALFVLQIDLPAQTGMADSNRMVRFGVSYTGDFFSNVTGGIKTGTCYLGMANIRISFSTKAAHLWKGGEFFVNSANTHGNEPSMRFLGDLQVASNIEAGNHTFMQEIWYKQVWKHGEITIGLQDLNINFVNSSNSSLLLNSSFGILPTVSGNVPAPIFPLTSLGISTNWKLARRLTLLSAVYDGSATDFDENPHNLNWDIGVGEGLLLFNELQRETMIGKMPGLYKAGIYIHQHFSTEDDHDEDVDTLFRNNNGIYFIGDQMFWKSDADERNLCFFIQLGWAPQRQNINHHYLGLGFNFTGLLSRKGYDIAGIAMAHDGLRGSTRHETTLEFTYRYNLFKFLYLQPDIQFIINPAGTGDDLNNCLAATLRFGISLE
jgi:porin